MSDETTATIVPASSTPPTPMTLIEMAVSQGVDPQKLGQLLDLQQRWEHDQARSAYFSAMTAAQAQLPRIVKNKKNDFTAQRYADLAEVNTLVMPVLTEHGFSVSFDEEETLEGSARIVAIVRHRCGYQERFRVTMPLDTAGAKGSANKSPAQAKGSTVSYARRYLMLMIGNLTVVDEDDDGNPVEPTLNEKECAMLETLILDCESAGVPVDRARFLEWLSKAQNAKAERMEDVRCSVFLVALAELQKKLRTSRPKKS